MDARIIAAEGIMGRVISATFLEGVDIQTGVEEVCEKYGVEFGYVFCMGSAISSGYHYLIEDKEAKNGVKRCVQEDESMQDLINGSGVICKQDQDGSFHLHMHATFCKADGRIVGGHLHKGYNRAMSHFAVLIFETKGFEMLNVLDPSTGFYHYEPR